MKMNTVNPNKQQVNTVFITGATGGLGKAFAVECASRGWDLFLTDKSNVSLNSLATGLRNNYSVKVTTVHCDLTNPKMRDLLFDRIRSESMFFTMLINVAGIDFEGLFYNQTSQQVLTIIRLNIEATLSITHALLPYRNQSHFFRIINVSSLAAFYPMPVKAIYAATKRFLLDFSLALREELRNQDATVTVLCPAGMPTNPICIKSIEAQGWVGQATTMDVGRVANLTLDAALAGKAIIIPGLVNRVIRILGMLIPPSLVARLIGRRWISVRQSSNSSLHP
jgi:hypothetical protein